MSKVLLMHIAWVDMRCRMQRKDFGGYVLKYANITCFNLTFWSLQTEEVDAQGRSTGNMVFLTCQPPDGCGADNQCQKNYKGERCAECMEGSYRHFISGKCEACPGSANLLLIAYAGGFMLLGFGGYQVATICHRYLCADPFLRSCTAGDQIWPHSPLVLITIK